MSTQDDVEISPSGNPIFRYTDGEKEWEAPHGEECIEEISGHIKQHIGKISSVFHEILSDTVHIDVHQVPPTEQRPFYTLVTSGMSDLRMTVPDESGSTGYMELMVTLPPDWKVDEEAFKDERWYWPVRLLKFLARFPHKYSTWLGWGHTIPHGDPATPYADNTEFTGVIILPPVSVNDAFWNLKINDEKTIQFFSLVPLYQEEMDLKLRKGSDDLLDLFDKNSINDIIKPGRKNVAKKRFGIF